MTDAAVIVPKPGFKATDLETHRRNVSPMRGAARLLSELKV